MEAGERDWGNTWRPSPFLTLLVAGVGASEAGGAVMDTLAVGRPGTAAATTEAMQSRQVRRAGRAAGGDVRPAGQAAGPSADASFRHDIHIVHERPVPIPVDENFAKMRRLDAREVSLFHMFVSYLHIPMTYISIYLSRSLCAAGRRTSRSWRSRTPPCGRSSWSTSRGSTRSA
jgi:hypothetical protein